MGAQRTDFMQLVADVQNAATLGHQLAQHRKQFVHGLRCEHRGGLVQNQQTRFTQQGADDFHPLHLAHAQGVHGALGLDVQAINGGFVADALGHFDQGQAFVQTQPDVLRHAQGVKQTEMLEHHADAQLTGLLGVANAHRLAIEADVPGIGLHRTKYDFHQGGLARTVFAQNGMNLTGHHVQGNIVIGQHGRVLFADAFEAQQRNRTHAKFSPRFPGITF